MNDGPPLISLPPSPPQDVPVGGLSEPLFAALLGGDTTVVNAGGPWGLESRGLSGPCFEGRGGPFFEGRGGPLFVGAGRAPRQGGVWGGAIERTERRADGRMTDSGGCSRA